MDLIDIEIHLFLEGVFLRYGYDFRNYSRAHIKRRVLNRMSLAGFESVSDLTQKVLVDEPYFLSIIKDFSINVTEMFRDPDFFKYLREEIIPILKSFPKIRIWHAGCSSGQEVYSMAILLKEEGLYDRSTIYATDFNKDILATAKEGIYPIEVVKEYTANYLRAGGRESFSEYYVAKYDSILLDSSLKDNIVFAEHNLVTDAVFNEMHLIMCRNVLIYFNSNLQDRVFGLFKDSLRHRGFLCLGSKESLKGVTSTSYETIEANLKVYRKS